MIRKTITAAIRPRPIGVVVTVPKAKLLTTKVVRHA